MSYTTTENSTSALINIKLTDTGRKKLAQGQLNFSAWAIGDSEINYEKESLLDLKPSLPIGNTKITMPFDLQPNLKHFVTIDGATALNSFTSGQINTIKAIVNNAAVERGFFSADISHTTFTTLTGSTYVKSFGNITNSSLSGGTTLVIGSGYTMSVNDFILLKLNNDTLNLSDNQNTIPSPQLWYKIQSTGTTINIGDTITLDRKLPNLSAMTATTQFLIYPSDFTNYYDFQSPMPYWNTNTLNFDGCCDISTGDVPVWNMNTVYCTDLVGMTGTGVDNIVSTPNENHELFGSYSYSGFKYPYMEISCISSGDTLSAIDVCSQPGQSVLDTAIKSTSIIHYTNHAISNFYGEFFFVDNANDKTVKLHLPDLMWHRRDFSTASGTTMGMTFIASGSTQIIGTSQIEFINLIEDPTLIPVGTTPLIVGRVLPQMKMVILTDDELIAANSYKSNRNWTLPPLAANLKAPNSGSGGGVLNPTETMWMTYVLDNDTISGLTSTLPCQKYSKIYNNASSKKDVEFRLSEVDMLPFMRKEEAIDYDGMGWSARNFKFLYQITIDNNRPSPNAWKSHDFTTTGLTSTVGATINPKTLENQNPTAVGFLLDYATSFGDTTYSLMDSLSMAHNSNHDSLQFGDERFFYGNLETYIGASIYKTTFNITVPANAFRFSSNPTRSSSGGFNVPDIRVSEVGIYDTAGDLVMIGKLSIPVKLENGRTMMLELSMDF
jgi:hypothetical protein